MMSLHEKRTKHCTQNVTLYAKEPQRQSTDVKSSSCSYDFNIKL